MPDDDGFSAAPVESERWLVSPLSLVLEEERQGDEQTEEALFLSYTLDWGFFERVILGPAKATGARVTVVGDATVAVADPYAARQWGRGYLAALTFVPNAAFHPKLMVLAGPRRTTVAIGSGNTTMAGWADNREIWTVARGGPDGAPLLFGRLAAWLRGQSGLPNRFTPAARAAFGRTADLLDSFPAEAEPPEARLVSSLEQPIIQQLPSGPVRELAVFAPFYDPASAALSELVKRLRPDRLVAVYQPGRTELDGRSLTELVDRVGGEIRADDERRYRHGKLVEWEVDGRRFALTGSPNLSRRALLLDQSAGGNCELGVVAPVESSRCPEGGAVPLATVRNITVPKRRTARSGPLLLAAELQDDGTRLTLVPQPSVARLRVSPVDAPPDHWQELVQVDPGRPAETVPVRLAAGSRLQLVLDTDSGPRFGNIIAVNDPQRVQRRRGTGANSSTPTPEDFWEAPGLAERFFADLAQLRRSLAGAASPRAAGARSATSPSGATTDHSTWRDYLDERTERLGLPLLHFALGLPRPSAVTEGDGPDLVPASWDEDYADDDAAGLESDETEDFVRDEPGGSASPAPNLAGRNEHERRRYRRFAKGLTDLAPELPPVERLLALRLTLCVVGQNAWDPGMEAEWLPLLLLGLHSLAETDVPEQLEPHAASLAAVTIAIVRSEIPRQSGTPENLLVQEVIDSLSHLLVVVEYDLLAEYGAHLEHRFGWYVHPEAVLALAHDIVENDTLDEAIAELTERGIDVHRHSGALLHVHGSFANPMRVALQMVAAAEKAALVGAWASNDHGLWALALWEPRKLITIEIIRQSGRARGPLWRHYELSGIVTPAAAVHDESVLRRYLINHGPLNRPVPGAGDLLARLGLDDPAPPRCGDPLR